MVVREPEPVEYYLECCEAVGSKPDPSVVTSLSTGWAYIKASNLHSLLPLLHMAQRQAAASSSANKIPPAISSDKILVLDSESESDEESDEESDDDSERLEPQAPRRSQRVRSRSRSGAGTGAGAGAGAGTGAGPPRARARARSSSPLARSRTPELGYNLCLGLESLRIKSAPACHPTHLSDANARVVRGLLEVCKNLRELDLSGAGLSRFGAAEVVQGLSSCPSLQRLNISRNPGVAPALADGELAAALRVSPQMHSLDLSNDLLGYSQVSALRAAMKEAHDGDSKAFELLDEGNNVFEEVLNALTHGVGAFLSVVGSIVLLFQASAEGQTRRTFYTCLVYCFCLVLLFVSSTALHAAFLHRTATTVLGLLDHAAIYFLIAGSYMPFCLLSLEDHPLGVTLALAEWGLAGLGIVFCLVDERMEIGPLKVPIELTLYVSMGWMIGFIWEDASHHVSAEAVELLVVGGAAYTFGILFFIMEKIHHPIGHAIWHIFVLVGAGAHYFAVLLFVVGLQEEGLTQTCIES